MNEAHEHCGSDEWREMIREVILPWALGETDLGDDVLEVGPGYGATTDVLSMAVPQVTAVEIDETLAAMLRERFADTPTVEIVNADATSLDYPDQRFTGAACFTMLHHVPTPTTPSTPPRSPAGSPPRASSESTCGPTRTAGQSSRTGALSTCPNPCLPPASARRTPASRRRPIAAP
jgi:SAM-dependent methyltransferase